MPRRSRRPPAKRRKAKRGSTPNIPLATISHTEMADISTAATSVAAPSQPRERQQEGRHIVRDYSYVVREAWYIAIIAGALFASLLLTAVFLRWT